MSSDKEGQRRQLTCAIWGLFLKVQLSISVVELDIPTGGAAAAGCMVLTAIPLLLQVVAHYDGQSHNVHCAVSHLHSLSSSCYRLDEAKPSLSCPEHWAVDRSYVLSRTCNLHTLIKPKESLKGMQRESEGMLPAVSSGAHAKGELATCCFSLGKRTQAFAQERSSLRGGARHEQACVLQKIDRYVRMGLLLLLCSMG